MHDQCRISYCLLERRFSLLQETRSTVAVPHSFYHLPHKSLRFQVTLPRKCHPLPSHSLILCASSLWWDRMASVICAQDEMTPRWRSGTLCGVVLSSPWTHTGWKVLGTSWTVLLYYVPSSTYIKKIFTPAPTFPWTLQLGLVKSMLILFRWKRSFRFWLHIFLVVYLIAEGQPSYN